MVSKGKKVQPSSPTRETIYQRFQCSAVRVNFYFSMDIGFHLIFKIQAKNCYTRHDVGALWEHFKAIKQLFNSVLGIEG